ncbi:MAG: 2'-5' RNA ligase family protein [Candidatus Pacearchaeota archaeon]|jgi:2'-5' RNA ligase
MKYIIVYLIRGEAGKYHKMLVNNFSKKFKIKNLNYHIQTHITLKYPFETKNIKDIEKVLMNFSKVQKSSLIKIKKIGHFRNHVLYLKTEFSKDSKLLFSNLIKILINIPRMRERKIDLIARDNFHATLGYAKSEVQFKEMWDFLKTKHFKFNVLFDNITILKKNDKDRWRIHKIFEIK